MNQDKPSLCLHGVYSLVRVGVGLDIREPKGTMNNLIITVVSAIHLKCWVRGQGVVVLELEEMTRGMGGKEAAKLRLKG